MDSQSLAPIDSLLDELDSLVTECVTIVAREWQPFHICLSGGVDSSLLLAILCKLGMKPECAWTMTNSVQHPDYIAAKQVANLFEVTWQGDIQQPSEEAYQTMVGRWHVFNGDTAVWQLFKLLSQNDVKHLLCTDGIDELMGGYFPHRMESDFTFFLGRLWSSQLEPLLATANEFGITVRFPFLDFSLTDYVTRLPIEYKTKGNNRKIIWRELAKRYLPENIIYRRKYGQCSMLDWNKGE